MILKAAMAALAQVVAAAAEPEQATAPVAAASDDAAAIVAATDVPDIRIPAKTLVHIAITEPISSKVNQIGDTFAISLAEPLLIDGRTVLPTGLIGRGEVTHAAKSGWGGKAGELIVNARYVDCGESRIPLGHFQYADVGKGNFGGAFVAGQIIPFGQFMVSGGEAAIPAGARATAKIKADVVIPAEALLRCATPTE